MADAQLMEEALQNRVRASEEKISAWGNAHYIAGAKASALAANRRLTRSPRKKSAVRTFSRVKRTTRDAGKLVDMKDTDEKTNEDTDAAEEDEDADAEEEEDEDAEGGAEDGDTNGEDEEAEEYDEDEDEEEITPKRRKPVSRPRRTRARFRPIDGDESEEDADDDLDMEEEEEEEVSSAESEDAGDDGDPDGANGEDSSDEDDEDDEHSELDERHTSLEEINEDDEDDEDEVVGAVKIRPGETDDEEADDASQSSENSVAGSDGEAAWAEPTENQRDDIEEGSEHDPPPACLFCKQDEEHDGINDLEPKLTCSGCGEMAHQQCARDVKALRHHQRVWHWQCPDCEVDEVSGNAFVDDGEDLSFNGILDADAPPAQRRTSAPKLARDLLPSQRGAIKPDSHSVFNQLVLDEDPMDGSRVLRKRKTSSVEADEHIIALHKRQKNTTDSIDAANDNEEAPKSHSGRPLRLKVNTLPATIQKRSRGSIVIKMKVSASELRQILARKPKGLKRRGGRRPKAEKQRSRDDNVAAIAAPLIASSFSQPFFSFFDKEADDLKGKSYGGILTEAEADTSKTMPTNDDRRRFDEAKQKAEEEWRQRLLAMQTAVEVPVKKSKKAAGPASQIECIEFGGWEIDTWYAAPYPEEYSRNRVLYICEFCLKYMNSDYVAWRHKLKCPCKHPPGDEIYRHDSISMFEVDGRKNPVYCQNLCLLAKLFLGSKTLYYDVEPFLFYVLCEYDELGYHFVGYFSKEKRTSSQNNVSCILTLPIHQRKGYGNLLIDFSYLLTRAEQKTGSPEKPLSDMGLVSYRNYWRLVMCKYFLERVPEDKTERTGFSITQMSKDTGLTADDVTSALEGLRFLVRDPETKTYALRVDLHFCREHVAKWASKNYVQLNSQMLTWTPYVIGRSNAANFALGPALNAIAPREDDDKTKMAGVAGQVLTSGESLSPRGQAGTSAAANRSELVAAQPVVLKSTEPNEDGHPVSAAGFGESGHQQPNDVQASGHVPTSDALQIENADDWIAQYRAIPPLRFEVFPPINARQLNRARNAFGRLSGIRATSQTPKSRPRARAYRKSSSTTPRSAVKRKSTGGTGRGPGRWPKGTKKADYGNAASGPGFPPGWRAKQALETKDGDEGAQQTDMIHALVVSDIKGKDKDDGCVDMEDENE